MSNKLNKVTSTGKVSQVTFADNCGIIKQAESGLNWKPKGSTASAVRVGAGVPVMLFNSGGSVAYVAFGADDVVAAASAATGIPIAAGEKFVMNSGKDEWVIGSASIFAYCPDEE